MISFRLSFGLSANTLIDVCRFPAVSKDLDQILIHESRLLLIYLLTVQYVYEEPHEMSMS